MTDAEEKRFQALVDRYKAETACPNCGDQMALKSCAFADWRRGPDDGVETLKLYQCPKCKNIEVLES
jgi:predicted RNA-binding Zn-ribbon protein involved in translation (DUF1610 family)